MRRFAGHISCRSDAVPAARTLRTVLIYIGVAALSAVTVAVALTRERLRDAGDGIDPIATEERERRDRESAAHASYLERTSEHFRILYEGSTQHGIGERVARVLEREHRRIGRTLNTEPAGPITVILYTNREFHDITRSPSWASGSYDGRVRLAVGGTLPAEALERVITHELVHAFVASAAPQSVPAWLNEGLATYLEGGSTGWTAGVLRQAPAPMPLESLAGGFSALDEPSAQLAYAESTIAAEILCAKLGANIGVFLRRVGHGQSIDDALLEFQVQPNAFHAEWRRRVGMQ
jgi:Peptidase MA superfamily